MSIKVRLGFGQQPTGSGIFAAAAHQAQSDSEGQSRWWAPLDRFSDLGSAVLIGSMVLVGLWQSSESDVVVKGLDDQDRRLALATTDNTVADASAADPQSEAPSIDLGAPQAALDKTPVASVPTANAPSADETDNSTDEAASFMGLGAPGLTSRFAALVSQDRPATERQTASLGEKDIPRSSFTDADFRLWFSDPDAETGQQTALGETIVPKPRPVVTFPEDEALVPGNATLRISDEVIELIKQSEPFRAQAERTPFGIWVIGYGHTDTARSGMVVSEAEADLLLRHDLRATERMVKMAVSEPLSTNEFGALVSLAYNIGMRNFLNSSVLARVNEGDRGAAARAFMRWNRVFVDGKPYVDPRLTQRRTAERVLFLQDA